LGKWNRGDKGREKVNKIIAGKSKNSFKNCIFCNEKGPSLDGSLFFPHTDKKRKQIFPHIQGKPEGSSCKVIYD
jgi:hypothetical protein